MLRYSLNPDLYKLSRFLHSAIDYDFYLPLTDYPCEVSGMKADISANYQQTPKPRNQRLV